MNKIRGETPPPGNRKGVDVDRKANIIRIKDSSFPLSKTSQRLRNIMKNII